MKVYNENFLGGRCGYTFKTPSPYEQLLSLPTPCFKFLERSLNNPPLPPHFKHLSLQAPPHPPPLPPSQKILIIHKTNLFRLCKSRVAKSLKTNHVQLYKSRWQKAWSQIMFNFTKVDGKKLEDKSCSTLQKSMAKSLKTNHVQLYKSRWQKAWRQIMFNFTKVEWQKAWRKQNTFNFRKVMLKKCHFGATVNDWSLKENKISSNEFSVQVFNVKIYYTWTELVENFFTINRSLYSKTPIKLENININSIEQSIMKEKRHKDEFHLLFEWAWPKVQCTSVKNPHTISCSCNLPKSHQFFLIIGFSKYDKWGCLDKKTSSG